MRLAVISDIHGNLHALDAVLAAVDAERTDALWCLGDVVGYGPRPNECCARVAERADLVLLGNHDLAVLGGLDLDDFAPDVASSARWTRAELSEQSRAFLAALVPAGAVEGVELYHGSPRDPVWEYVLRVEEIAYAFAVTSAPLVLVGHSHVALAISLAGAELAGGLARAGTRPDLASARWLLNPGSVGQPRDGDPRAAYLVLEDGRRFAEFRRVSYPVEKTQREIRDEGLPEALAARLEVGH